MRGVKVKDLRKCLKVSFSKQLLTINREKALLIIEGIILIPFLRQSRFYIRTITEPLLFSISTFISSFFILKHQELKNDFYLHLYGLKYKFSMQ